MRPKTARTSAAVLAALLTLGGILAFAPVPTAAAEGTTSSINFASFNGITTATNPLLESDRSGNIVALAYVSPTNAVLFSYSLDSGATWTNRATGITISAGARPHPMVVSATTFRFLWSDGTTIHIQQSTDSGLSWTEIITDAPLGGVSTHPFVQTTGTTAFYYGMGGGCNPRNAVVRYWSGSAWSTVWNRAFGACTTAYAYITFEFTDPLNGIVWTGYNDNSMFREIVANGAVVGGVVAVDDSFTPIPGRVRPFFGVSGLSFACGGTPSRVYSLRPDGASAFISYQTGAPGALCSALDDDLINAGASDFIRDGNRFAFVTSESTTFPLTLWASCDEGVTWARTELEPAGGTSPSRPTIVGIGETKILAAFKYGGNGIAVVTNHLDPTTCTGSPVGGGSQAQSGDFTIDPAFCSNPNETRWGYNFQEDVVEWDTERPEIWNIDHGYLFVGDTDDYAFLAKGNTEGTSTLGWRILFKIEAEGGGVDPDNDPNLPGTNDVESVFRAGFSFRDAFAEGWVNELDALMPFTDDAKGNGGDPGDDPPHTGVFADFIEARFEEEGQDWEIRVVLYAGANRYELGQAVLVDDPEVGQTYSFEVDTGADPPFYRVRRISELTFESEQLLANAPLEKTLTSADHPHINPAVFTSIDDDAMYSQWFIGAGTIAQTTFTVLDDGRTSSNTLSTAPSTCIYDFYGTWVPSGSVGRSGPAAAPNGDVQPTSQVQANPGTATSQTGTFGGGLIAVSARNAIFMSIASILAFLAIGYRFTAGNRRRGGEE